jgi:hypothetical protein
MHSVCAPSAMPGLAGDPPGVLRLAAACAALSAPEAAVDAAAAAALGASVPPADAAAALARAPGVRFPIPFGCAACAVVPCTPLLTPRIPSLAILTLARYVFPSSLTHEVNFIALLALLRFGSGWEPLLARGRSAPDSAPDLALRGLFALHVAGCVLT